MTLPTDPVTIFHLLCGRRFHCETPYHKICFFVRLEGGGYNNIVPWGQHMVPNDLETDQAVILVKGNRLIDTMRKDNYTSKSKQCFPAKALNRTSMLET